MSTKSVTFGGVFTFPMGGKESVPAQGLKERFNCGSLRSSLKLVTGRGSTLISVRLVRSKLRKREETNSATAVTNHNNNNVIQSVDHSQTVMVSPVAPMPPPMPQPLAEPHLPPPFLWRYSTASTNSANSQHNLQPTNNDQSTLVHGLPCDEVPEGKSFRKNLRGKWKRLVKKKPQQEVYTIPAELRDQLKQIYVY
ncbi:hypothetical protein AAG570_003887 [Ranatra chinensis]|uniref:Uncharacterized protein n=1 Tax=Ranatra chinensis TaxID=642074 RepID=A0ABD0Y271_9HEMI